MTIWFQNYLLHGTSFFLKDTPRITNGIVSLARSNGGRWTVNFAEFRASRVEFEGKPQTVYFHKS